MSVPLFIFAATICQILEDDQYNPVESLLEILAHQTDNSKLNGTYLPVLDRLLMHRDGTRKRRLAEEYRKVTNNTHDPQSDSDYVHQSTTGGAWFNAFLDLYLPQLEAQGTLVIATFDEATWQNDDDYNPNNKNQITTILFGAGVTPNTQDDTYITHYGLLRGAIQNFGLGSLGRNDTNVTNGNLYDLLN